MSQSIVVQWDTLRTLAFGAIGGAYAALGTPFDHVSRILILQNFTDTQIFVSFDGINNNLTLPPGGQIVLDYMSDQSSTGGQFMQSAGTQIYIKDNGTAATSGNFYASNVYGKGE